MRLYLVSLILGLAVNCSCSSLPLSDVVPTNIFSKRTVSPDNTCGYTGAGTKGYTCDPTGKYGGSCCSSAGWCGNITAYCGTGCQSKYGTCSQATLSTTNCGPAYNNQQCAKGLCCSLHGFCGIRQSYCGAGCQAGYGICIQSIAITSTKTASTSRSSSTSHSASSSHSSSVSQLASISSSASVSRSGSASTSALTSRPASVSSSISASDSTIRPSSTLGSVSRSSSGLTPGLTSSSVSRSFSSPSASSTSGSVSHSSSSSVASSVSLSTNSSTSVLTSVPASASISASKTVSALGSASASTSAATSTPTINADGSCGPNYGGGRCDTGLCCSASGYCGTAEAYCNDPDCQWQYGTCDSDTTPAGTSTLSDSRPSLGNITYTDDIYTCTKSNVVALTYDDGPYNYTSQLLDVLKSYGFTATFFITGNNLGKGSIDTAAPWPSIINRMISEGHQVASHTWSHYSLSNITSSMRIQQMVKNERAFANIIGKYPTYMRPPYSQCSQQSGCWADMQSLGYHRTYFDLDTQDYLNPTASMIQNSKDIVASYMNKSGVSEYLSIQHDLDYQSVANLSSYYFDLIQKRGWKGVTAGECLNDPEENWYRTPGVTPSSTVPNGTTSSMKGSTSTGKSATSSGPSTQSSMTATGKSSTLPSATSSTSSVPSIQASVTAAGKSSTLPSVTSSTSSVPSTQTSATATDQSSTLPSARIRQRPLPQNE